MNETTGKLVITTVVALSNLRGKRVTLFTLHQCTREDARKAIEDFKSMNSQFKEYIDSTWQAEPEYF